MTVCIDLSMIIRTNIKLFFKVDREDEDNVDSKGAQWLQSHAAASPFTAIRLVKAMVGSIFIGSLLRFFLSHIFLFVRSFILLSDTSF